MNDKINKNDFSVYLRKLTVEDKSLLITVYEQSKFPHRLEANTQADNTASIKLVAKAGITKKGYSKNYLRIGDKEWKDHERWATINNN